MFYKPQVMKTKLLIIIGLFLITNYAYSQVGIGNTAPKSILDIQASNQTTPANTDGLLIPRIDAFPATDPGADQDGMLVFYTPDIKFYYWDDANSSWIPITSNEGGNHYVGELYQGGIIFYIYENGSHGLIASLDDLGSPSGNDWGKKTNFTSAESWWDGATNTTTAAPTSASNDAVKLCEDYSNDGYSDWHLPSITELKALEDAGYVLAKLLDTDGDANTNYPNYEGQYWSSTQTSKDDAYSFKFQNTHTEEKDKDSNYLVRAIRSF